VAWYGSSSAAQRGFGQSSIHVSGLWSGLGSRVEILYSVVVFFFFYPSGVGFLTLLSLYLPSYLPTYLSIATRDMFV